MKEYLAIITDDKLTAWGCDIFQLLGTGVTLSRTGFVFKIQVVNDPKSNEVLKKKRFSKLSIKCQLDYLTR